MKSLFLACGEGFGVGVGQIRQRQLATTVVTKRASSIALEALFLRQRPSVGGVVALVLVLGLVWLACFCGHDRRNAGSAAVWFEWEPCLQCSG